MNASTPVFQTIKPLSAPSSVPAPSASSHATGITQSPRPAKIGHVMLSSRTMAAMAKVAPTLRSILPLTMTMVMPIAMIPIGADCLSKSSMFSQSIKALSDKDRNSPAMLKKISSNTMKPQIAPLFSAVESVPGFMSSSSRDWRQELAALGCDIEPDSKDDDDPGHNELDVELQAHEQETVLDKAQDKHTDDGLEYCAGAAEQRRTTKDHGGKHLKLQPLT